MTRLTASSGLRWWLASNIATAVAFPLFILRSTVPAGDLVYLLPTTLVISSAFLKLVAVSPASSPPLQIWRLMALLLTFTLVYKALDIANWHLARLAVTLGTLSLLMLLIARGTARNARWKRVRGREVLILSFAASGFILAGLAVYALFREDNFAYFSQGAVQSIAFALNLLQLTLAHVGFIAVVIGRMTRATLLRDKRQYDLQRRRQIAEARTHEMEAIARERHALLELLSHEVRQPLNNAQAALQEISRTIGKRRLEALKMAQPVARLYDIIDQVVLALSNAIVAASLIERGSNQAMQAVDLAGIVDLARGDCAVAEQSRIVLEGVDDPVFTHGDPVLLRLALRNLLDNALKFSPADSEVIAALHVDDIRLGLALEVLNHPTGPFSPSRDLFERGQRGGGQSIEGKGLGLFIVHEVARLHGGSTSAEIIGDGRTRFEIFLPA